MRSNAIPQTWSLEPVALELPRETEKSESEVDALYGIHSTGISAPSADAT